MTVYDLTYTLSPEMQSRAMMSWAKPTRTRAQKLRRFGIGALCFVVAVAGLVALLQAELINYSMLFSATAGFYGAIVLWVVMHRLSTGKLMEFANDALMRHGPVHARLCADEVVLTTRISSSNMRWTCFDDVIALPDATVARAGALVYAVPDAALPQGVTPDSFRADLTRWMEAAQ